MTARLTLEPFPPHIAEQLAALGVDHAIAALTDGQRVVGYTMCHTAGPKNNRTRCTCTPATKETTL